MHFENSKTVLGHFTQFFVNLESYLNSMVFTNGRPEFTHVLSEVQDSTIVRQQRIGNFLEGPCNFKRVFPIA